MWNWSEQCEKAFVELKRKFTTAVILGHYHREWKKKFETDSRELYKAGIWSQYEPDRQWHHLSSYKKRFLPTELNYYIYDKEILVIFNCFQECRHFLKGAPEEIVVFTNHKNLEYFNSTNTLNQSQVRWAKILSQFNLKIVYCPGEKNGKADSLSR